MYNLCSDQCYINCFTIYITQETVGTNDPGIDAIVRGLSSTLSEKEDHIIVPDLRGDYNSFYNTNIRLLIIILFKIYELSIYNIGNFVFTYSIKKSTYLFNMGKP